MTWWVSVPAFFSRSLITASDYYIHASEHDREILENIYQPQRMKREFEDFVLRRVQHSLCRNSNVTTLPISVVLRCFMTLRVCVFDHFQFYVKNLFNKPILSRFLSCTRSVCAFVRIMKFFLSFISFPFHWELNSIRAYLCID